MCPHRVEDQIKVLICSLMCFLFLPSLSQERFTQDTQPHYIYSPREMTRWVRGIFEALRPLETLPVEGLIRIWAHEALRLFQDRWGGNAWLGAQEGNMHICTILSVCGEDNRFSFY